MKAIYKRIESVQSNVVFVVYDAIMKIAYWKIYQVKNLLGSIIQGPVAYGMINANPISTKLLVHTRKWMFFFNNHGQALMNPNHGATTSISIPEQHHCSI